MIPTRAVRLTLAQMTLKLWSVRSAENPSPGVPMTTFLPEGRVNWREPLRLLGNRRLPIRTIRLPRTPSLSRGAALSTTASSLPASLRRELKSAGGNCEEAKSYAVSPGFLVVFTG